MLNMKKIIKMTKACNKITKNEKFQMKTEDINQNYNSIEIILKIALF